MLYKVSKYCIVVFILFLIAFISSLVFSSSHYLKVISAILFLLSVIPATVGSIMLLIQIMIELVLSIDRR